MTSRPDLVVHVGVGASGPLLASALPLLADVLARQGVRTSVPDAVPSVGGAPLFVTGSGDVPVPVDPSDAWAFCSLSHDAVATVIAASGARRARVVLCPERQDRLLERTYRAAVADGFGGSLAELFPRRFEPLLDYSPVAAELQALPGVVDVRIVPNELVSAGRAAFVGAVLAALDPDRPLDLRPLTAWTPPREFSPRGVQIAAAMAPLLDTDVERGRVRDYVLSTFSVAAGDSPAVLTGDRRARILEAHREGNRGFFTRYASDYPASAYGGRSGLAALAAILQPSPADTAGDSSDGLTNTLGRLRTVARRRGH